MRHGKPRIWIKPGAAYKHERGEEALKIYERAVGEVTTIRLLIIDVESWCIINPGTFWALELRGYRNYTTDCLERIQRAVWNHCYADKPQRAAMELGWARTNLRSLEYMSGSLRKQLHDSGIRREVTPPAVIPDSKADKRDTFVVIVALIVLLITLGIWYGLNR